MRSYTDKIPPNPHQIMILALCMVGSCFLAIIGHKGNPPITTHSMILIVSLVVIFLLDTKTVYFSKQEVQVRYLIPFLNKVVQWEHVLRVEVADDRYILIVLEDCPLFSEADKKISVYISVHRKKLIALPLFTQKQYTTYVQMIRKYYPNIIYSNCQMPPVSASTEPIDTDPEP